jgi:hypothetical protein
MTTREPLRFDTAPFTLQMTSGGFRPCLLGLAGAGPVQIYASSDLVIWAGVFSSSPLVGPLEFIAFLSGWLPKWKTSGWNPSQTKANTHAEFLFVNQPDKHGSLIRWRRATPCASAAPPRLAHGEKRMK